MKKILIVSLLLLTMTGCPVFVGVIQHGHGYHHGYHRYHRHYRHTLHTHTQRRQVEPKRHGRPESRPPRNRPPAHNEHGRGRKDR